LKRRFILASGSPRRRELLAGLGFEFEVDPAQVDESLDDEQMAPAQYAERLALCKARDVADRYEAGVILAADTIVVLDGAILEKPSGFPEAVSMLRRLAGRTHVVITAYAIIDVETGKCRVGHEATRVHLRDLDDELIRVYVGTGEPMDKAGAYAIQGLGSALVEWIEGCFYNVVGLPVHRVASELEEFGLSLTDAWHDLDRRVRTKGVTS